MVSNVIISLSFLHGVIFCSQFTLGPYIYIRIYPLPACFFFQCTDWLIIHTSVHCYPQTSVYIDIPVFLLSRAHHGPSLDSHVSNEYNQSINPTVSLFTDGSGADGKAAGASTTDKGAVTWGEVEPVGTTYLGTMVLVQADGERAGVVRALKTHQDTPQITILTDSMAALSTAINLSKGTPARSGIERTLATQLAIPYRQETQCLMPPVQRGSNRRAHCFTLRGALARESPSQRGQYVEGFGQPDMRSRGERAMERSPELFILSLRFPQLKPLAYIFSIVILGTVI